MYVDPLSGERKRQTFYGDTAGDVRDKIKAAADRVAATLPRSTQR